ncbi:hypothetical protein, partial [Sphingomonas sp. NPDC092410]
AGVRAIVITGADSGFSAGADIREFGTPKATQEPSIHTVIRAIVDFHRVLTHRFHLNLTHPETA